MRRPQGGQNFSVEGLFATVREHLPGDIAVTVAIAPYASRGIVRRVANLAWAREWKDRVVHVTGDIMYVTPVLGSHAVITFLDIGWVSHPGLRQAVFEAVWCTIPTRKAKIVTTISDFTRTELLRLAPNAAHKIRVIPCCYDPVFRRAEAKHIGEIPVILCVGTTPNKNLERLFAALEGIQCLLHIVGPLSGAQRLSLQRHGIRWKHAVALSQAELVEAYVAADIVAFASLYEGFGLPIIEAQAVGRPVITSTVASMPEVAGKAALLVDPTDVSVIRKGIRGLLESEELRIELRERGFENVRRFDPSHVASEYAAAYREAAS